jgi:hypothetical protein
MLDVLYPIALILVQTSQTHSLFPILVLFQATCCEIKQLLNSTISQHHYGFCTRYNDFFTLKSSWTRDRAVAVPAHGVLTCGTGADIGFLETCP